MDYTAPRQEFFCSGVEKPRVGFFTGSKTQANSSKLKKKGMDEEIRGTHQAGPWRGK